ncbi:MAG: filamentous hemagglutinin N-terminal domain-containing protein [Lysobacteraceae bacterium]|nr:MAG: filamentous hemagglutinin N-terminal domain-containing protein [Xanthomonadaceae bacterium]
MPVSPMAAIAIPVCTGRSRKRSEEHDMRMKQTSKRIRSLRRRRLALALVGAMAMPVAPALAQTLPDSGSVVSGSATIGSSGNEMTITQTTKGAIIDWNTFSIGNGYGVTFNQQFGNTSVTLNRVVGFGYGLSPSIIDGNLSANGNVFLINPAGITFGSGAVVNVGGLVASTLWMNQGDFESGNYIFNGFNGDTSTSHQVRNNGAITAGAGGVAFVGPTLWNSGSIVANGGNIGFGAGTTVTLDFVGDGLTQVTINAAPTVDSVIVQDRFGTMTADGRQILMRTAATATGTGGGIYVSGNLRAQSILNVNGRIELTSTGGPVMLGAPGILSDAGSPFTAGTIDVSGQANENGGSVLIRGASFAMVNDDDTPFAPTDPTSIGSMINASGGVNGGQIDIGTTAGVLALPLSLIVADGTTGSGGLVRIQAGDDILLAGTDISAASKIASGGAIALQSSAGSIVSTGTLVASGPGTGGTIGLVASAGTIGLDAYVDASGSVNGGQVIASADNILISAASDIRANGGSGNGGSITLAGATSLAAYGLLSAHGGTAGGSIGTFSGDTFDIQGLRVDAGSAAAAGTWTLWAPNISVVDGDDVGPVDGVVQLGQEVQDADINYVLATGTNVTLRAGTAPGDGGYIYFQPGVDIFYDDGTVPLQFRADADGSIYGDDFSISSNAAALSMAFNADSSNLNNGFAGISFSGATFDSSGGNIEFYGQSDLANGVASSYGTGVELIGSTITTAGGNVLIRGASTGDDAGSDSAGVVLSNTSIDAGSGAVAIHGTGEGVTSGVILGFSDITAGAGGVVIDGESTEANGLYGYGSDIVASGGDISLTGIGGAHGVYFDGGLYSYGGDITVHGEGGTYAGVDFSGPVDSGGGDITMYGYSAEAIGLEFGGGYYSGMVSAGGDIALTGYGATGGVALYESNGSGPVALFAPGDVDEIDSGGGDIAIIGTASATDAVGVYLYGIGLVGTSGDVTVDWAWACCSRTARG